MRLIKKLIARISTKRNIKMILVFLVFVGFFVANTFAAGQTGDMSTTDKLAKFFYHIVSFLSWGWVILANLAGKLMTNDILYGSFLHLDTSLWNLWNIIKNFANFALGFMILFAVIQNIFVGTFGKGNDKWAPLKVIKKALIAGVLIQMSWFLMGAVVDLSTIMTSAVGSFPSQFLASDDKFRGNFNENLKSLNKAKVSFDWDEAKWGPIEQDAGSMEEDDIKQLIDSIMPGHDSVSGPLLFLGLSVFEFNEITFLNETPEFLDDSSEDKWGQLFMSIGISATVLIVFSLMMLFIFVFNLFRIIVIWIIIPLLPMIILLKVFDIKLGGKGGSSSDLQSFVDIKNIIVLVFKPIIMVGALSLILVILILVKSIMTSNNKVGKFSMNDDQMNIVTESVNPGAEDEVYNSTIQAEGLFEFTMSNTKTTIADLIVYLLALFLIYFLTKITISTKTGFGFIDKALENGFESLEKIAKNLPIVPIAGGVGISSLKEANVTDAATRLAGIDTLSQNARVAEFLGLGSSWESLSVNQNRESFIANARKIANDRGMTDTQILNDDDLIAKINKWNDGHKSQSKVNAKDITSSGAVDKVTKTGGVSGVGDNTTEE
ncbi:MAG TPA: hypothetical protein P5060_03740 [Candidatus Absconditabacterales bacterium]|nr:hypothetical protein [Candidatus Absconditabacterales bacterium]